MNHQMNAGLRMALVALLCGALQLARAEGPREDLLAGWQNPPRDARLRAYWWWLNGNVTSNSITRDLEEMKAKGFGGALICDADGSSQDGNDRAPQGPTFLSPEWRALYRHALHQADRLGLEMSLNIQSGWNLGGPMVTPDDAAKKLTWSDTHLTGPTNAALPLRKPFVRDGYYRDLFVVGYRMKPGPPPTRLLTNVTASSWQPEYPPKDAADGRAATYWVSGGTQAGEGPAVRRPEWLQFTFEREVVVSRVVVMGRPGYGPRECELHISEDGTQFRAMSAFVPPDGVEFVMEVGDVRSRCFRLVFHGALDPRYPDRPRNVQVAEVRLEGKEGVWPHGVPRGRPIQRWEHKAMYRTLNFSAPDTAPLFQDERPEPGEADTHVAEVVDLTEELDADGVLRWDFPEGRWEILRFGCTIGDHSRVSTCSQGWEGYAVDVLDAGAFQRYWEAVVEPLIADAGPLAGGTLKYLHTDSWEVEAVNWTPTLRGEFRKRRGYDLVPWLPTLAGRIVNSREESNRFYHDFRRVLGDLAIDNHYVPFKANAHKHGLRIHPESGGPHASPIDAQRCLGMNDAPMSEFWAWSWRHRVGDHNRFFVKQPASAAHTYGHKLVLAEGFTTIGPHWQETLWDNLKPSFDKALCEGLNLLVWHAFVCSPESAGIPGQQYFAGTHLNPLVTWWDKSGPFFDYLNRCQFLLQEGLFVADVAYFYGDHVPNFAQLKSSDPAQILPGYDYDVITGDVILTRLTVKDGRLVLPDGMNYRVLVLRDLGAVSLPVLRGLRELLQAGATIIGERPNNPATLTDYPQCDTEFAALVAELWGGGNSRQGQPRVIAGQTARQVLLARGVKPDFEFTPVPAAQPPTNVDYLHRRAGDADIYFVANRATNAVTLECAFRVTGKAPELWNAVTGERRFAAAYTEADGRTTVPLEFAPCGSWFVIFREPVAKHPATAKTNAKQSTPLAELAGPWTVKFDPKWGGPESAEFPSLVGWEKRPEPGIKFYSGTATYVKTFDLPPSVIGHRPSAILLDLGDVRELAEVRVNGKPCGITWTPPFRVDITDAVKPGANSVEIAVVNFWPNRIIGDAALPEAERRTKTNIRKLTKNTALMPSGLFGPVRLLTTQ